MKNNVSIAHRYLKDLSNISYTTSDCRTFYDIQLHIINSLDSNSNGVCFRIVSFELKIPFNDYNGIIYFLTKAYK